MRQLAPTRRSMLVGVLATLAGGIGIAAAQPVARRMGGGMMGGAWGPMGGGGMGHGVTDMPGYLEALKAQLVITDAEAPAWKAYADTVSGVAAQMAGLREAMMAQMPNATWSQRRAAMNQMFAARKQAYETVHRAAEKLLPALDPAQRSTAQAILPGLRRAGMMR